MILIFPTFPLLETAYLTLSKGKPPKKKKEKKRYAVIRKLGKSKIFTNQVGHTKG
jgi:hypothetical protein